DGQSRHAGRVRGRDPRPTRPDRQDRAGARHQAKAAAVKETGDARARGSVHSRASGNPGNSLICRTGSPLSRGRTESILLTLSQSNDAPLALIGPAYFLISLATNRAR